MSENRDVRDIASISITADSATEAATVKCPICKILHPLKLDRNGNPYFTLSCVGSGSNIFPRTPFGRECIEKWKDAASSDTVPVPDRLEGFKKREIAERIGRLYMEHGLDRPRRTTRRRRKRFVAP